MTEHSDITKALYTQLRNLIEASKGVVEAWPTNRLAEHVNILDATQETAEQVLDRARRMGVKP